MIMIIIWAVIWIAFVMISILKICTTSFELADFIITIGGFIGLSSTLFLVLYQNNLTVYFYWTRIKNWLRNYSAKWQISIRFDGNFNLDVINHIKIYVENIIKSKKKAKILHKNLNSINFSIYDTMNFYVHFEDSQTNNLPYKTLDIVLSSFEIGTNDSRDKLNKEIIPIFSELQQIVKPENTSYVLDISFRKHNPFYTVFISHLKTSQIRTFTVDLLLNEYSNCSINDLVTVNKNNIIINAQNVHALKELSNDFIYLSPNIKKYLKDSLDG